ncbi:MAG TPA: substrate-binding domain-containing protein [Thermoanaerobaculia bacterium]|nr:substrate-binding domain-containing protein [Thermoanaerobaculia bacterium]
MMRSILIPSLIFTLGSLIAGCAEEPGIGHLEIATTTSVESSGLLEVIRQEVLRTERVSVDPFVVGSGKAFGMARRRTVELVITHDPEGEAALRRDGVAERQRPLLANHFVLVGPRSNPAGLVPGLTIEEAMERVHRTGSDFTSRADQSGTHAFELRVWAAVGLNPHQNPGYREMGQSMSALLRSAAELEAYALTDEATFAMSGRPNLVSMRVKGDGMENTYVVSLVAGAGAAARRTWDRIFSPGMRAAIDRHAGETGLTFRWIEGAGSEPPVVP